MNELASPLWYLIHKYPTKPWNWYAISQNPNITMDIIEANPGKPWNWYGISINPNITMEHIEANPGKPWNWSAISMNPNITLENIEANLDKINFTSLSSNKFTFIRKQYQNKQMTKALCVLSRLLLLPDLSKMIVIKYFYIFQKQKR